MEQRQPGSGGLDVGVIGMGTWRTFDVPPGDGAALASRTEIVDRALQSGVNFFDSSPMYGRAEAVLGRALGDRRQSVLVATKVWSAAIEEGQQQIDQALKHFGGSVDVYQVHNLVEWQRYLPILRDLQKQGRVRLVGITHYAHSAFPAMIKIMESGEIQTVQIPYNAADRRAARDILPLAEAAGIGVIVMSPLGTGDLVRREPPKAELEGLQAFGIRTWAQALLKWVVSDSRVTVTIPATSRPERAAENAEAGTPPFLPEDARERIAWLTDRIVR